MKPVVFLGPTLSSERARECLDCEVRPPAAKGDVLRALTAGARRIGIVDGYFQHVPSVWHKEILYAIEQGALVFGGSSMGALRAAELRAFGMIGVGRVFEWYRDGVLADDDEVAVTHGPAEDGYRATSEAMVNIRDRIEAAVGAGVVRSEVAARLVSLAKALPYHARSYRRVAAVARESGLAPGEVDRIQAFVTEPHVSLKERDAVAMLSRMAAGEDSPAREVARVERTVFFERLRLAVAREAHTGPEEPGQGTASPVPFEGPLDALHALLGLLAEEHADLLSVPATDQEIETMARDFCVTRGLLTPESLDEWLHARGLTLGRLMGGIQELATIRRLEHLYGPELDRRVRERSRLR